jgi:hypothetical protein
MSGLYSLLPTQSYSLKEFIERAKALYSDEVFEFLTFILTGEDRRNHQAILDPFRNVLPPGDLVDSMRDYDSVIGITEHIVVRSAISVYPIPNPVEVLTTSIHLKYGVKTGNVRKGLY